LPAMADSPISSIFTPSDSNADSSRKDPVPRWHASSLHNRKANPRKKGVFRVLAAISKMVSTSPSKYAAAVACAMISLMTLRGQCVERGYLSARAGHAKSRDFNFSAVNPVADCLVALFRGLNGIPVCAQVNGSNYGSVNDFHQDGLGGGRSDVKPQNALVPKLNTPFVCSRNSTRCSDSLSAG